MIRATIAGVFFTICSLTAAGQSKSDSSKTARDFLIEQEESHGKHPDSRNRNRIENIKSEKGGQSATEQVTSKKKKKCCFLFCRKNRK